MEADADDSRPTVPDNLIKNGKKLLSVEHDFLSRLTEAARRDGRLLDPLWRDLSEEEEDNVAAHSSSSEEGQEEGIQDATTNIKSLSHYTTQIQLTSSPEEDVRLYEAFRDEFAFFPIANIPHKSFLEGNTWESLLHEQEHTIEDAKVKTFLRANALHIPQQYSESTEGLLEVPRAQFLVIELARIKEGIYGRNFRRNLELLDIRTQSDQLESCLLNPSQEEAALQALRLLRTQWPNPSISVLKTTGVVKVLRRGFKSGSTETIRTECQRIFNIWKDLRDLGEVNKSWGISAEEMDQLRPILQKAGDALVQDLIRNTAATSQKSFATDASKMEDSVGVASAQEIAVKMEDLSFQDTPEPFSVANAFDKFGVVMLNNYLVSIDEYMQQSKDAFEALIIEHLEPRGIIPDGKEAFSLPEAQQKAGRRIDSNYGILDDPDSPIAKLGQKLQHEIPRLLFPNQENNFHLTKGGVVSALPDRTDDGRIIDPQSWHRPGQSLFINNHHAAHCFTLYIPLVHTVANNGAIEFVPGTHIETTYNKVTSDFSLYAQRDATAQHKFALQGEAKAGSILVLDIRLLRRGLINRSLEACPMIYFTFAKTWFCEPDTPQSRRAKSWKDPAVHTKLMILSRLRQLVTGITSSHLLALDEMYGHKHYTNRFDLLLLDGLLSDGLEEQSTAMVNMAAVVHFCTLSEGDKEIMAREFVYSFSQRNHNRKILKLQAIWKEEQHNGDVDSNSRAVSMLYNLAASILIENSTLLKKLGFSSDEHGVCCLLAMLKAHATRQALGCIGVTENQLEESFTSWWHASEGRFTFLSDVAESEEEQANRKILVVFSGLCGGKLVRPEWSDTLMDISRDPRLDVLHVIDPSLSMYCQDPDCLWKGCDYYSFELEAYISNYQGVMFLGEAIGGTAALQFSTLADRVVTFTPTVDVVGCKGIPRPDIPEAVKEAFQQSLLETLKKTQAAISIHYGEACRVDAAQIQRLPRRDNIELIPHDYDGHDLSMHLKSKRVLPELVEIEIREFLEEWGGVADAGGGRSSSRKWRQQQSVMVGSF